MALLDVILGYDCNLACTYCTITPEMRRRALTSSKIVEWMREARSKGYEDISFTGGEPTIRGDLLGLVRKAKALGFRDIKVQSNGLVFAQVANVKRLMDAGASRFHISIHSHRAAIYEEIVRRPGSFPLMARSLVNLARAGVDPTADVILMEQTYRDLPDALLWLHELGVMRADLWFVSLTDGNRDNVASMPRLTEVTPVLDRAFAVAEELRMSVRSLHVPRCLLGAHADRAFDPAAERVMVMTPDDVFELSGSKLTPQVYVPACEGCPERSRCRGLRPDYLERYGDSEVARARGVEPSVPPTRLRVVS